MNNSTLLNTTSTYAGCTYNWETLLTAQINTGLVTSVASFVGNLVLIVVVYRTRTVRTFTDYFVVSMAASDIFLPSLDFLNTVLFFRKDEGNLSQTTGAALCKFLNFFWNVSYGVSMLTLAVIAVYRFYAVAFPMRARVQSIRTRTVLLLLTWVLPIAFFIPELFLRIFDLTYQSCIIQLTHQFRIWYTIDFTFFFFLPLLVMLFLYPAIIVKLRRQKIPGQASCYQAAMRRRKQNFRLTTMFITITVTFIVCWGMHRGIALIYLLSLVTDWCILFNIYNIVITFPMVFHAINPLIYFIFCPSYRQGIKQLLSFCCRHTHAHHAPGGEQIPLDNIPQVSSHP